MYDSDYRISELNEGGVCSVSPSQGKCHKYILFNNNTPHSDQKMNYLVGTPVYSQNRAESVYSHLTLSSLPLPLSSSFTTSRELLSQFEFVVDEDDLKY